MTHQRACCSSLVTADRSGFGCLDVEPSPLRGGAVLARRFVCLSPRSAWAR
jgi:hypothetical protein